MILLDRSRRGPDRYLTWKVRAFWLGAVLGVLGMFLESVWLTAPAILVLLVGVFLRFFREPRGGAALPRTQSGGPPGGAG
ncbi:MAG: hypothetical protein HY704_11090 [Gemmatimonadetes bacterium]|nr:hypothetical protein [Gemmatimonadota bacterium]